MERASPSLFLVVFFTTIFTPSVSVESPDHYFNKLSPSTSKPTYKEYFQLIHPLPSDHLTPSCALHIIHHTFANTVNQPPYSVPYSPPIDCPPPWPYVALEFRANSCGDQYDRISGLWLGGAELLRTSTGEPSENGIFWSVRKDITRYTYLLKQRNLNFTIMLENIVNDIYTGGYHVDVAIFFYKDAAAKVSLLDKVTHPIRLFTQKQGLIGGLGNGVYESPSDLIIPICSFRSSKGYWFKIEGETDVHLKKLRFPSNTFRAVLEVFVSFHGNDEFWYSNPSNTYIKMNNLTSLRGNGAFREVFMTIDGKFVDSEVPFPVIFTGGINPLFWEPAVAIGAFDLPTYDFDLTPYLGILLDGKDHMIGLGVNDGISYWLVDANLHLWLDQSSASVEAKSVVYQNPGSSVKRQESFKMLDGSLSIKGKRKTQLVGWIKSSMGNFTTTVMHEYMFKNLIRFGKDGTHKRTTQSMRSKREVKVMNEMGGLLSRAIVKRSYPLKVMTLNLPGTKKNTYMLITNVSHAFHHRYSKGNFSSTVNNKQVANGWMEVKDLDVIAGKAITNQTLTCQEASSCYVRSIAAIDGRFVKDNSTHSCPSYM